MSENIAMDAGPKTRYFIFLLSRIEEIGDVKARRLQQTLLHESLLILYQSRQTCRDPSNLVGYSREDLGLEEGIGMWLRGDPSV
jgi:hypothetical protein